ncbi:hypothetical protein G4B88_003465 [Cannabis sativa]|uniref:Uncharacterized protein n=1 Tax=Cannabis sativa TaxID=3483 RepID=A0A7J6GU35_CANSA|nr:hypothetical protein G4B88_003465 [Cannabis sativa]
MPISGNINPRFVLLLSLEEDSSRTRHIHVQKASRRRIEVSLVLGQIQVEAKTCCPTTAALNFYNACRILGSSKKTCASLGGCKIISGNTCSKNYIYETLGNNGN